MEAVLNNEKVRKTFRKIASGSFKKIPMLILFYVASRPEDELITQTDIAQKLKVPITTVNYHIIKLKSEGFLNDMNRLTNEGIKVIRFFKEWDKNFDRKIRAHNIQLTIFLKRPPDNFEEIRTTIYEPFTNKRYRGLKAEIQGCKVLIYSKKKAITTLPDIYASNDEDVTADEEIAATILHCWSQLKTGLEMEFPGLEIADYKPAKFTTMHVAVLDSIIAKSYILKTGHNYSNGRVAFDKSHDRYELESEDVDHA
ncbi:MAG: winged helix-turn-helix transcriptional regulator, partial [Candidatus Woesearchaeota archaeon]